MRRWIGLFIFTLLCAIAYAEKPEQKVGIALYLNDITRIQPQEEIIELEATIFLRWQSEKKGVREQYFYGNQVDDALKTMWWPYFIFLDTRGTTQVTHKAMKISNNGMVEYMAKYTLSIETALNMHKFPFDTQTINIQVTPFGPMPYRIQYYLLNDKIGINPVAHIEEWELTGTKNKISAQNENQYQLSLNYQRKSGYYLYKVFLPMLIIVFISYMVLWLPRQPAINRLAVIITAMLTIVAFQWAVTSDVPKVSYITFLQAMVLFFFIMVGLKAILVVIGESVEDAEKYKLMHWSRIIYPVVLLLGIIIISWIWFSIY
ncbi:hypothetical protein FOG18_02575 [Legionella israelensis]|uniref:hypothetical protein n=1 Tax=Legionella israelensis TaxID=454 RepID=UPI0011805BAF|nr:hypothetical protein [Legionella israelensis]QDP71536.1 hypothetical protein FOG18_02575 [Legionella israelensis]